MQILNHGHGRTSAVIAVPIRRRDAPPAAARLPAGLLAADVADDRGQVRALG